MKHLALLGAILLCASWSVAQAQSDANNSIRGGTRETTIQGCLDISAGAFTLTLPSGAIFTLSGKTAELKGHVGEALQVTGVATPVTFVPGSMSEGEQTQPTLWVRSFRSISAACSQPNNNIPGENTP